MVIRNINDLDCSEITLITPYKFNDDYYVSEVLYKNKPLTLQTPILTLTSIDDKKVYLNLDSSMIRALTRVDNSIITIMEENSLDWFKSEFTGEQLEELYKPSTSITDNCDSIFETVKADGFRIYSKTNPDIDQATIENNAKLISLIRLKYVIFYKSDCFPMWENVCAKIKKVKLNEDIKTVNLNN